MKLTSRYTDIHPGLKNVRYEITKIPEKIKNIEFFKYTKYVNLDLSLGIIKVQSFLNCYVKRILFYYKIFKIQIYSPTF
jgi:hypothetical protein